MRRRDVIGLLGLAAVAWPLGLRAQQTVLPVIGYLSGSAPEDRRHLVAAFRRGVRESGLVEEQNVVIEYRWAQNDYARLQDLAADLIRRQVSLIAATDTPSSAAAKAVTKTIPIVFASGSDPVKDGVVASLNRPGGNITGITFLASELGAKQLGLLQDVVPAAERIAALVDPEWPVSEAFVADLRRAGLATRKEIVFLNASSGHDIDTAFATFAQKAVDALVVGPSALTNNRRVQLVTLAAYHRVPTIYFFREHAEAGGLMSYGTNITDAHRQAGVYAGRILKGEKPADLPVIQSTKFEFVINLNTARAFGITFPPGLLAIADEVIE
jgi:putative tryptophan/tyrosine transport system substrate-binding protein